MTVVTPVLIEEPGIDVMAYSADIPGPEIVALMERSAPAWPPPFLEFEAPAALVVPRSTAEGDAVAEALQHEGWAVLTCAGPGHGRCPLILGEPCRLREAVDVALVFVDGAATRPGLGSIARVRCAADSASPGVLALEGRSDPAAFLGTTATIGVRQGPAAVVDAIERVMDGPASPA